MNIKKFTPFKDIVSMQEEMNKIFTDFFRRAPEYGESYHDGIWNPSVDISETDNAILVKAEIPGVGKDDIDVTLHDDIITIRGEKKEEKREEKENCLLLERTYGKFQRSFRLPSEVDPNKIKASFKDGILNLELPKSERAKPKEIKIDVK
ncbi:MAG: Hsp20/alpha crystallin family protein [bacterium]|nr:Hsp20/alpha crystallin family protein [bacterium]